MTVLLKEAEFSPGGTVKKDLQAPTLSSQALDRTGKQDLADDHNIGGEKFQVTPKF